MATNIENLKKSRAVYVWKSIEQGDYFFNISILGFIVASEDEAANGSLGRRFIAVDSFEFERRPILAHS